MREKKIYTVNRDKKKVLTVLHDYDNKISLCKDKTIMHMITNKAK